MASTSHAASPTTDPAPPMPQGERHRARWAWLALGYLALVINIALLTALITGRGPGSAIGDGTGAGTAVGSSPSAPAAHSPLDAVGTRLGESSCITSRLIWTSSTQIACATWSATLAPDRTIAAVTLYAAGRDGFEQYLGTLPLELHWGDTIADVAAELGAPRVIYTTYGSPRLIYAVRGEAYRALELQFDSQDTLVEVSATLAL